MPPPQNIINFHTRGAWIAAAAATMLLALVYSPGLSGDFLFDDFINLDALGRYGGVRDWHTFLYFITGSEADPTGRPVAQLSFLVDARNWPADPWPFKRTNLLIHLFNGALLFALLQRVQRWLPTAGTTSDKWTPLLAATLWAAHPLWVSTTLYVVQRQAMLATTFVLIGLFAWDRAYRHLLSGSVGRGWCWIAVGVGGATLLAGLSKANGFLLPLLALALWWAVQSRAEVALPPSQRRLLRLHVALGLGLPSLALIAFLLQQIPSAARRAAAVRDWSLAERMLSQPRALLDYLGLLIAPREGSGGLFADSFVTSKGLFEPWTTLPALLAFAALLIAAVSLRRKWPSLSAALLLFFAGHLLESGPVPLELYFEHRNYLPAILLGWPVAQALLVNGQAYRVRVALAVALPLLWMALTWQRALVWGDPPLQAALWAERNPDSPRAQGHAAQSLVRQGQHAEARALLAVAAVRTPSRVEIALNRIAEGCESGTLNEADLVAAEQALRELPRWNQGMLDWLDRIDVAVLRGKCIALGQPGLHRLLGAIESNSAFTRAAPRRQELLRWHARAKLAAEEPVAALHLFNSGLEVEPKPQVALAQAAELGNAGYADLGLRHLDHYSELDVDYAPRKIREMGDVHRWLLLDTGYYQHEFEALHQALQNASNEMTTAPPADPTGTR